MPTTNAIFCNDTQRTKKEDKMIKQFLEIVKRYFRPYKVYIVWSIVLNIIAQWLNVFSFVVLIPILNILFKIDQNVYTYKEWTWSTLNKDLIVNNAYAWVQGLIAANGPFQTLCLMGGILVFMTALKCIGYWAFDGCTRLKKVITPDIAAWCAISFDSADANPLFYAKNLYSNYTKITDLVIPEGVTGVGDWAFYNCTGLTSLTMSDGVTNIGDKAFYGCTGLTNATFPSSMTSIGDEAFYGCTGLKNVICNIETPLSISVGTFSHRANATLYVPAGTKDAYETADYWKDFKEIVEMEPVPNEDTTGINSLTPGSPSTGRGSGYYTLDGLKLGEKPTKKGTYVVNGQKVMVR